MMKNTKKIAILLLVAVVAVGSYFVAGTYAKYTSEVTGTDSARVALWSWKIDNTDINLASTGNNSKTFAFDLFNSSYFYDSDCSTPETTDDVNPIDGTIVAPGTCGKIVFNLKNASEVGANYDVSYAITNTSGVPLEFTTDPSGTWYAYTNIASVVSSGTLDAKNGSTLDDDDVTVWWRWAYQVDGAVSGDPDYSVRDTSDTDLGIAGTATPSVTATVVLTQVD